MAGFSDSKTRGVAATDGPAKGPCLSEAEWITSQPEFEASARLKSLLLYLAKRSDEPGSAKVTQIDIARDVMRLNRNFDPSFDAHVRIEISRLRSVLCGFYSRRMLPTSHRLSIPKGCYRTQLETVQQDALFADTGNVNDEPVIALGSLCADDHLSRRYGFEIECQLLTSISNSAFNSDDLLSFCSVEGSSLEALAKHAEQLGAGMLLVTRVLARKDGLDAYLSVIRPRDRRIVDNFRLHTGANEFNRRDTAQMVSRSIAAAALDPIGGRVLQQVYRLYPKSKISRLSAIFAYISSQDRSLLPDALASAKSVSHASEIARALSIDMSRASYCFATDCNIREMAPLVDEAEALVEQNPDNAWSNLALGYAGISTGSKNLLHRAISAVDSPQLAGSQLADFKLLQSLSGSFKDTKFSKIPIGSPEDETVFDTIRLGYAALRDSTDDIASDGLQKTRHKDVFWVQAFQISAHNEKGQPQRARDVFGRMKKAHPSIDSYMHRAISTMIPDRELRGRMLAGLDSAAH